MTIEVLYPEVCDLYGDLENPEYLARALDARVVRTSLSEKPRFTGGGVDLVYMGSAASYGQKLARDALAPHVDALTARTASGGVTLFTGSAFDVLGHYILEDGVNVPMLGLLPFYSVADFYTRYNAIYLGKFGPHMVVGHKSRFGHSFLLSGAPSPLPGPITGLFETLRGMGLGPDTVWEGMRSNNLFATCLLGPLLIQNPPFARHLLSLLTPAPPNLPFEAAAMDAYARRLSEYQDPRRGVEY